LIIKEPHFGSHVASGFELDHTLLVCKYGLAANYRPLGGGAMASLAETVRYGFL